VHQGGYQQESKRVFLW